jgi:hypothetical protein
MARVKTSTKRITTSQRKILPSRRRIKKRMRVASCAVSLIIGKISAQTVKEENLNLTRRLQA